MSLARGFFYSGARSVVSSLWPITDKGGREIMQAFYKNLSRGDTKTEALRKAKLGYLKQAGAEELKHPYYWAGFIVLGDTSPLAEPDGSLWLFLGLGLLLMLIILLVRAGLLKFRQ